MAGVRSRGYYESESRALGRARYGADAPADLRETLFMGPPEDYRAAYADIPEALAYYAPNIYPDNPAGLRRTMTETFRAFDAVIGDMFRIVALALDLPETFFTSRMDRHFGFLAYNYYPPYAVPPKPGQIRVAPHTDFGAMTLLAATEGVGGLEVRLPDGHWLPVQPFK